MAQFTCDTLINAPVEAVFELFADIPEAARRIQGIERIEMLTDGPVGVGTRFRETRIFFNREATEEMEFTDFEAPERYRVECRSHGAHYLSTFNFIPEAAGTRVQCTFEVRPLSLFAKLMSPFAGAMMGSVRKCTESDMRDLKAIAESESESSDG
jgi:carbon monoxide dehydrogenase subunit G